jgi:hypothetical protein
MNILKEIGAAVRNGGTFAYKGVSFDVSDRQQRMTVIDAMSQDHSFSDREIEYLTDLILNEEITDSRPDKMTLEDYPIMSDTQLARRQEGKHVKKGTLPKGEISIGAISNFGTDGRNYRYPSRAKRTTEEYLTMDYENKSRNEERHRKYREFTKVQPVKTYFVR